MILYCDRVEEVKLTLTAYRSSPAQTTSWTSTDKPSSLLAPSPLPPFPPFATFASSLSSSKSPPPTLSDTPFVSHGRVLTISFDCTSEAARAERLRRRLAQPFRKSHAQ